MLSRFVFNLNKFITYNIRNTYYVYIYIINILSFNVNIESFLKYYKYESLTNNT